MDRLRFGPLDWRRAQAKARDDLARRAGTDHRCVSHPGPFSEGARREAERFALLEGFEPSDEQCGAGLNGLSCTYRLGHCSELHSWEIEARLPQYRIVGEGT